MSQNSEKQIIRAIFSGNPAVIKPIPIQATAVDSSENLDSVEAQSHAISLLRLFSHCSNMTIYFKLMKNFNSTRVIRKLNVTEFWREQAQCSAAPLNKLA